MTVATDPYVLIVDDYPVILMDLDGILSDAGFRCVEAGNGDNAKALLPGQADSITLLFSDVEMPGGTDGFVLARHVSSTYPWIEIVIASGRIKPGPGDMPENATFLGKPFTAKMIHNHLRERLPDGKKPEPLREAV